MGYLSGYAGGYESHEAVTPTPAPQLDLGLLVEIDFANDINAPTDVRPVPIFTDVTSYVRQPNGYAISRGRHRQFDRNEAGTATVLLDNFDRTFDPNNSDGPFFPNVTPQRRLRISTLHPYEADPFVVGDSFVGGDDTVGGGDGNYVTTLFDGSIQSWAFDYPQRGFDATATIQAADGMAAWAQDQVRANFPIELGGNRINRVLNTRAWTDRVAGAGDANLAGYDSSDTPSPQRSIYVGAESRLILDFSGTANMLDFLRQVAVSEGGNLFIGRDGTITYFSRLHGVSNPVTQTFTFDGSAERYQDVSTAFDNTLIYNDITVTAPLATEVQVTDDASISRYFRQPLSFDTQLQVDSDLSARALELLNLYREPHSFIARFDASDVITDWKTALEADLWTKVNLVIRYPNGDVVSQESLIEGIELSSGSARQMSLVWWLSPAPFAELLEDNQADFETGIGGWNNEDNAGLSWDYRPPGTLGGPRTVHGYGSLIVTPLTFDDCSIITAPIDVSPNVGYFYTAHIYFVAPGAHFGKQVRIEIDWLDSSLVIISTAATELIPEGPSFGSSRWLLSQLSARSPVNAAFALLRIVLPFESNDPVDRFTETLIDVVSFQRS